MTDEERIQKMLKLVGETGGERQCRNCRWRGYIPPHECSAPIVVLERGGSAFIHIRGLRKAHGICGPNGLLWERRYWWRFIRLAKWWRSLSSLEKPKGGADAGKS